MKGKGVQTEGPVDGDRDAVARSGRKVRITLYIGMASHPCVTAELMLAHKALTYKSIELPPLLSRPILRAIGFSAKTVPAMRLDGQPVQGSRSISHALDQRVRERPLFPADPDARAGVEEAEAYGEELQNAARRIEIWGLLRDRSGVELQLRSSRHPYPARLGARLSGISLRALQRVNGVDEATVRRDLTDLPTMLDRFDSWIEQGVLKDPIFNAADYQIAPSISLLMTMGDLRPEIESRPVAGLARRLVPSYPMRIGRGTLAPYMKTR
jgi:glutathione S-transferase